MFEFLIISQTQRGVPCELSEGLSAERVRGWAASAEIAAAITREGERGIRCSGRGGRIRPIETRVREREKGWRREEDED